MILYISWHLAVNHSLIIDSLLPNWNQPLKHMCDLHEFEMIHFVPSLPSCGEGSEDRSEEALVPKWK